ASDARWHRHLRACRRLQGPAICRPGSWRDDAIDRQCCVGPEHRSNRQRCVRAVRLFEHYAPRQLDIARLGHQPDIIQACLVKIEHVSNPMWTPDGCGIRLLVKFEEFSAAHIYTATLYDVEAHGRELLVNAMNGLYGEIAEFSPTDDELRDIKARLSDAA